MNQILFTLYVLFLPLTDVGIGIPAISPPTLFAALCFFTVVTSSVVTGKINPIQTEDLFLFAFLASSFLSLLLSVQQLDNEKMINHFVARPIVFFIFFWSPRYIFIETLTNDSHLKIFRWLTLGVVIACIYCLLEFVETNVTGTNLFSTVPRLNDFVYDATGAGFFRARSFVEESGHFAFFLEVISPLALWFVLAEWGLAAFWGLLILIVMSLIATISSATFIIIPIGIIIALMACRIRLATIFSVAKNYWFASIAAFLVLMIGVNAVIPIIIQEVVAKLTVGEIGGRGPRLNDAWNIMQDASFLQWIFGFGPASFYYFGLDGGILSLYLSCIFELGALGLILLLCFFYIIGRNSLRVEDACLRFFIFLSFTFGLLHFLIIQNYWYPWYWFALAFMSSISNGTCLKVQEYKHFYSSIFDTRIAR